MDDYDYRPGGSLKLKGGVVDGGVTKKYVQR
jgi:protein FAM32A